MKQKIVLSKEPITLIKIKSEKAKNHQYKDNEIWNITIDPVAFNNISTWMTVQRIMMNKRVWPDPVRLQTL